MKIKGLGYVGYGAPDPSQWLKFGTEIIGAMPARALPEVGPAAAPQPTLRQLEVLSLLARGEPNKRIAAALGIAERTVKLHISALLALLGARNRTQLLVLARDRGLL